MEPLITVSIGTYNREKTIGRAIESVLSQTYKNFELVIVDNGSTDRSGQIAEEYTSKDNRIRTIHVSPNQGSAMRFNMGIALAKGEFLTYLDDDDYLEPDFLEFMYRLIRENDADVSICACPDRGITGELLVMTGEEAIAEMFERKRYNARPSAKLYRRALMKEIRFPDEAGMASDAAVAYKILANAKRVAFSGVVKYQYIRHEGMNSSWTKDHSKLTPQILDWYGRTHLERRIWLNERFPYRANQFLYYELAFDISMVEKIDRYKLTACEPQRKALIEKLYTYKDQFMASPWLKDFEKEWMERYVL